MTHRTWSLPARLRGTVAALGLTAALAVGVTGALAVPASAATAASVRMAHAPKKDDWNSSTSDQCISCVVRN
ncbi:hypothetical protein [Kitasatospora sp. NBC_01266]|uniref:hypothetical protein n=1 Tax=Kitasatospora sp. NBC_01266 TaxID=2903572 RepID=UPI002E371B23|nr:hypothetical protein [Kitasatospora sp. NBC_01266]